MYSTYTKLSSYGFSSTAGVTVVTKVYVASGLGGSSTRWAHSKKPPALRRRPDSGRREPTLGAIGVKVTSFASPFAIVSGKMDQPGASKVAPFQPSPNVSCM
jgi:hypothetical protein